MNNGNYSYQLLKEPNKEIVHLLSETIYGTQGGLLLQHKDVPKKLKAILGAEYHTIWQDEQLCAVAVYCKRTVEIHCLNTHLNAYYIRYFSVYPSFQNLGIGKKLTEQIENYYRNTLTEPTIFYAYIENKNLKSQAVSNHFEPIKMGVLSPVYFSRFFPKKLSNTFINQNDISQQLLRKKYKELALHSQVANENYFKTMATFNNSVIQYSLVNWEIHNYPSNNFIMNHILPHIPFLNRLAEGKKLRFIAVERFYYEDRKDFFELLEHVLAIEKIYKAMIYLDHKDPQFEDLISSKKLGMMNKIQKRPNITMQTFFLHCDENTQNEIIKSNKYISGFDVT